MLSFLSLYAGLFYALGRALSASLTFGVVAKLPGVAVIALAALWMVASLLVSSQAASFQIMALFFELSLGVFLGLAASLPIVVARMGLALGDARLSGPYEALGGIIAGVVLFGAGLDRELLRAFFETFRRTPPGEAAQVLLGPEAVLGLLDTALRFGARVGFISLSALLVADLFNSVLLRLSPGHSLGVLPRDALKALAVYASLSAIGYTLLQAAATALRLW